ncbi:hypothetical protein F4Y93_10865 [Candidatus Poribacteria bacterium]|nr:hypothetical protein [Candidatus Poribacteria bacterium]
MNEKIQHTANICIHDQWYAMIVDVFSTRNIFYQHSINRLGHMVKELEPKISGCKGNSPTEETRQKILRRFDQVIEAIMLQYLLSMQNFKGFELVEIRHTLEVVTQYLQSARAHFQELEYIDCHLRVKDAIQYMHKAEMSADLLMPINKKLPKDKQGFVLNSRPKEL